MRNITKKHTRGLPVSSQIRDNYVLELNKGYVISAFERANGIENGVSNTNPYNARLTDNVYTDGVEKQLSSMKRKTYTPEAFIKPSYTSGKEALYDIRNVPLNDQYRIGNYLPETLKDRNRNKVFSSQAWSKNFDMMRTQGQTASDVYNSMLLTTETNIPNGAKMYDLPAVDERLRISQETYQRPFKDENNRIQDMMRLRNSSDKIRREQLQRISDVNMRNENIMQLGRYNLTANKWSELNEGDIREQISIDKPIKENFTINSTRKKSNKATKTTQYRMERLNMDDREHLVNQDTQESSYIANYYHDTPNMKKDIYNRTNHMYVIKNGDILEIYPDDITNNTAPIIVTKDHITNKPIRTLATVDKTNLYIVQKRDPNDIYDNDGASWNNDYFAIKIPFEQLNPIWRKRINDKLTSDRKSEGVLDFSFDELTDLVEFAEYNQDKGIRINTHELQENTRVRDWAKEIDDNFYSDHMFVMPDMIKENREYIRQKAAITRRGRIQKEDNYVTDESNYVIDTNINNSQLQKQFVNADSKAKRRNGVNDANEVRRRNIIKNRKLPFANGHYFEE